MLQVNLSLRFSQKFTFAKLKPAAIKLIAVVASCACFISPATHPNVDNSQTGSGAPLCAPPQFSLTTSLAFLSSRRAMNRL